VHVVSLHPDVLVATSRVWQTTCTIVRSAQTPAGSGTTGPLNVRVSGGEAGPQTEAFVIDSPILPDELDILPTLLQQARFPPPSGLLATHADWDHLLGRLAFPDATLGCTTTTAERRLRAFDDEYYVRRERPLSLGAAQALEVPGCCEIGSHELALHPADGHTVDGMAVRIDWASVLVTGDYLSAVEIPVLGEGGSIDAYLETLERLRALISESEHIVPGHGPVLDSEHAMAVLEEDRAYLRSLHTDQSAAELPRGRRTGAQHVIHRANVARVGVGM
jgi:glyoxylase-like metal-dependent hydrolase (beta-lactamase superfamily II)